MKLKSLSLAILAIAGMAAGRAHAGLVVVDAVNESAADFGLTWGASDVGWLYTPTFSYDLVGINTRFGSADGRFVTAEIYDGLPSSGGNLLRSVNFNPAAGAFAGGQFAPLSLAANTPYFVGFRNVSGLIANATIDAGAEQLPGVYYSDDGSYGTLYPRDNLSSPILQFVSANSAHAPEPSSLALLGMGAFAGLVVRKRKAKSKDPTLAS